MSIEAARGGPKLRTKTGCLTCRNRRKKCDEQYPLCNRCSSSSRKCIWPSREALQDRRYGSRRVDDMSIGDDPLPSATLEVASIENQNSALLELANGIPMEPVSRDRLFQQLEPLYFRHFFDHCYDLLINPDCQLEFYDRGRDDAQKLMSESEALKYSILAIAASHLAAMSNSPAMEVLALDYYSKSMRRLSEAIAQPTCLENYTAVLMSVILLYIHGCLSRTTYKDVPFHLNAAKRIIQTRFLDDSNFVITRPFDQLAVESAMYNMFIASTSYWFQSSKGHDYEFDAKFWLNCEDLLKRSKLFPDCSTRGSSMLLGVSVSLFKLNMTLKRIYAYPQHCTSAMLSGLKQDLSEWKTVYSLDGAHATTPRSLCDDSTFLYVMIAALLLEDLEIAGCGGIPRPVSPRKWQLEAILEVLRRRQADDNWHQAFITTWPVYTIGFLVSSADDVNLIRNAMQRRWDVSKSFTITRYRDDLESFWKQHQLPGKSTEALVSTAV